MVATARAASAADLLLDRRRPEHRLQPRLDLGSDGEDEEERPGPGPRQGPARRSGRGSWRAGHGCRCRRASWRLGWPSCWPRATPSPRAGQGRREQLSSSPPAALHLLAAWVVRAWAGLSVGKEVRSSALVWGWGQGGVAAVSTAPLPLWQATFRCLGCQGRHHPAARTAQATEPPYAPPQARVGRSALVIQLGHRQTRLRLSTSRCWTGL